MERIRAGTPGDESFLAAMAQLACGLEDRPLPAADSDEVRECLPATTHDAVVAVDEHGAAVGAAWWHLHDPPLVIAPDGSSLPEMTIAVVPAARNLGIGAGLIEAVAGLAATRFDALALNVHLRNPAARLYTRTGFRVDGKGRGWFGVAMTRSLRD